MKAIILAAGRGSRMNNLTESNPKCLVEVNSKSLLQWQIDALNACKEIDQIGIVTGYMSQSLDEIPVEKFHNENWAETNMVMSLLEANAWLESEECLVSYSDILYKTDVIDRLSTSIHSLAISYDMNWRSLWKLRFNNPLDDAESFKLNDQGFLIEIGKKTKKSTRTFRRKKISASKNETSEIV